MGGGAELSEFLESLVSRTKQLEESLGNSTLKLVLCARALVQHIGFQSVVSKITVWTGPPQTRDIQSIFNGMNIFQCQCMYIYIDLVRKHDLNGQSQFVF